MPEQPSWRTSSYTSQDTCVEVADNALHAVMVRDTKDRGRGVISVPPAVWAAFLRYAKASAVGK
ncbi:DUF397 domain-containing protein [Streptomyces sp. NPDC086766]|uniref:DUF397 domain-containing protein n=1 Tax=Streptomyces sp. NPDC086766 TaxID=3365754 RepID=UPI0038254994